MEFIDKEIRTFKNSFWIKQQNHYEQILNEKLNGLKKIMAENFEMETLEINVRCNAIRKEVYEIIMKKFEVIIDDLNKYCLER